MIIPPVGLCTPQGEPVPREANFILNNNWGYTPMDRHYKTASQIIRKLVEYTGKNGNMLVNVSPAPKGEIPKWQLDFSELQKWYDGYVLNGVHIYNPKSVTDAMRRKKFKSYWAGTETYEALKIYIDLNFDGLKEAVIQMLGNGKCKVNTRKFQNDMTTFTTKDDVLTLLIHLGYLTFDEETDEVFIPNQEIAQEFLNVTDGSGWEGVVRSLAASEELLKNT